MRLLSRTKPHVLLRIFAACVVTALAVIAPTTSAEATTNKAAVIGMPFNGRWAYSNSSNANCGPASTETSHPSCHDISVSDYDWALDVYAPAGTAVKLKVTGLNGTPSFSWGASGTSCEGSVSRRINVSVDGTSVGSLYVTHLASAASTGTAPTNGMTIGTVFNGSSNCNPGGSYGKHVHWEFSGVSDRTCYVNYTNPSYKAGMDVNEGDAIGGLGGPTSGTRQACGRDDLNGDAAHSKDVIRVKKTADSAGHQQVYTATTSDVWETWWGNGASPSAPYSVINIAQNNIVGFDKIQLPDGTQSVYAAVPDGVWESWWRPGGAGQAKIIQGLSDVKDVIADTWVNSSNQLVHELYVLTGNGPREYWWIDGDPAGIQSRQLETIYGSFAFVKTSNNGVDQIYTANAGWVYETEWTPGSTATPVSTPIINISQNNITAIDKVTETNGTETLYTATSTGIWGSWWGTQALSHSNIVNSLSGIVDIKRMTEPNGTVQLYAATSSLVQEYWWSGSGSGGGTIFPHSGIKAIDRSTSGSIQQLYAGTSGGKVWETWWGNGSLQTGDPALVNLN